MIQSNSAITKQSMSKEQDSISHELAEVAAKFARQDNLSEAESQSVALTYSFSLKKPFLSNQTIEELLNEGYIGVDYELGADTVFAAAAYKFQDKVKWTRTQPNEDGDIALMTTNLAEFDQLLEFMLDKFGWCPQVYINQKASEIFIFTPQNDLEKGAITLTIDGDYGWQGSLYSLDYFEIAEKQNILCLIFATKPKDTE